MLILTKKSFGMSKTGYQQGSVRKLLKTNRLVFAVPHKMKNNIMSTGLLHLKCGWGADMMIFKGGCLTSIFLIYFNFK